MSSAHEFELSAVIYRSALQRRSQFNVRAFPSQSDRLSNILYSDTLYCNIQSGKLQLVVNIIEFEFYFVIDA